MLMSLHRMIAGVVGLALIACSKDVVNPPPVEQLVAAGMLAVTGSGQTGTPGQTLLTPPTVRVVTSDGRPVPNITVVFTAGSGGSVVDGVVHSDANGVAVAGKWILGPQPGQQTLTASVPGLVSVTFVATVVSVQPPPISADRVLVGSRPYGLATLPNGMLYTSQLDGRTVTRVQFGSTTIAGVVNVGLVPTDVTFNPSGSVALVTNQFDSAVGIIDVATNQQVKTITGLSTIFRVIVAPDGKLAYASETGGRLMVIDVAGRAQSSFIPVPQDVNGIAFGRGDTLLYITSMRGSVSMVNLRTNTLSHTWGIVGLLQDVVVSPDGNTLYVAEEDAPLIYVIDAATGAILNRITTSAGVFGLKLSPDGKSLFASQPSNGQVLVVDRVSGQISHTYTVGGAPRRIVFDKTTGRAVVSNEAGWLDYLPLP